MTNPQYPFGEMGDIGPMMQLYFDQLMWTTVPLAIGVFVSLWLVMPVTAGLGFGRVLLSAVVATLIGIALVLVVTIVRVMGVYGPMVDPTSGGGFSQLVEVLRNSITTVVLSVTWDQFAITAAAVFGLWGWQQSRERRLRAAS
jgi:hypothetical protein